MMPIDHRLSPLSISSHSKKWLKNTFRKNKKSQYKTLLDDSESTDSNNTVTTAATSSVSLKSCFKTPTSNHSKKYQRAVSFHGEDRGRYILGLHEYTDEEFEAVFVHPEDNECALRKAITVAAKEREYLSSRQRMWGTTMRSRGLEKIMYPECTAQNREEMYDAVLRTGDMERYKTISYECLCRARYLAEKDERFANRYYSDNANSANSCSSPTTSPIRAMQLQLAGNGSVPTSIKIFNSVMDEPVQKQSYPSTIYSPRLEVRATVPPSPPPPPCFTLGTHNSASTKTRRGVQGRTKVRSVSPVPKTVKTVVIPGRKKVRSLSPQRINTNRNRQPRSMPKITTIE